MDLREIETLAYEAEKRLVKAVRSKRYPKENLPVLEAWAAELCELEYCLVGGFPVWDVAKVIERMGGRELS